jgi:hypothetical protein
MAAKLILALATAAWCGIGFATAKEPVIRHNSICFNFAIVVDLFLTTVFPAATRRPTRAPCFGALNVGG